MDEDTSDLRFRLRSRSDLKPTADVGVKSGPKEPQTEYRRSRHPSVVPFPLASERHSHQQANVGDKPRNFWQFFSSELSRGYTLENDGARFQEKRKKVYAFIKIPKELEKFLMYGFLQCSDAFLFMFTFLPLRFLVAVWHFVTIPFRSNGHLSPPEICDVLKVVILTVSSLLMLFVDTSVMYHVVRGQAVIKLYIFYNMLEVADKLFSSFGQDILDALFWTATERKTRKRDRIGFLIHLFFSIVYVVMHTLLVLLQATTLNVAFNSHNKALLTIMMSNNFVELKGSVFKKFAKNNLFQMSCSDVRERFHYCILLFVVVVRNMAEFSWKIDHFWEMLPDLALVLIGEFVVDWLKHAFITKFNDISYEVYKDFTITISYDVASSREKNSFSDHADQVSRRMGFIPLPLTVLLIRVITQSIKFNSLPAYILLGVAYLTLLTAKMLNSLILLGSACYNIEKYEEAQRMSDLLSKRQGKSKSVPVSPKLSLVEFSDVMQQSQVPLKGMTFSDVLARAAEMAANSPKRKRYFSDASQSGTEGTETGKTQLSARTSISLAETSVLKVDDFQQALHETSFHEVREVDGIVEVETHAKLVEVVTVEPMAVGTPLKLFKSKSLEKLVGPDREKNPDDLAMEGAGGTDTVGQKTKSDLGMESLASVDRFTLCNNDRIE